MSIDIVKLRDEFPILKKQIQNTPLVYLDSAASSQKPRVVIDSIVDYYTNYNANIHRGVHTLSDQATQRYEQSRQKIADFLGAKHVNNVIFTSGTTSAINTVAYSFCESFINPGDEILISAMEHHANIVPWQMHTQRKGASIKVIPLKEDQTLDMEQAKNLVGEKTRLIAISHCSNTLGIINPMNELSHLAKSNNIPRLVDGAQAASFIPLEVDKWDIDFYTFSAHKMFGPTGVGVLFGKHKWLNQMVPFLGGGDMIKEVTFEQTTYNELPHKFEAGTPNIAGVIATGYAVDFINEIGKKEIHQHEQALLKYVSQALRAIPNLKIYGDVEDKTAIISFNVDGIHPFDIGQMLDAKGIAVRTGHHCTQPLMDLLGVEGTVRLSFSVYNTMEEAKYTVESIKNIVKILS